MGRMRWTDPHLGLKTMNITTLKNAVERIFRDNWYPVTLGLFLFPVICLLLGVFGFLVGIPITKWHAVAAFALNLVAIAHACRWEWKKSVTLAVVVTFLLASFGIASSLVFDDGYYGDGQTYHKPAAIAMKNGWNPIRQFDFKAYAFEQRFGVKKADQPDWLYDHIDTGFGVNQCLDYWVMQYPKADWIIAAVLYAFSGNMDQAQFLGFVLFFCTIPVAYVALHKIFALSAPMTLFLAVTIACNPIFADQFNLGYVDGKMGLILSMTFLSLAAYYVDPDKRLLPFFGSGIIIATNLKFTGALYIGVFLAVMLGFHFVVGLIGKRKLDAVLYVSILCATIVSLIAGINPYIYNLYRHQDPFYPIGIAKEEKTGAPINFMMPWYASDSFNKANRFQRFVCSHMVPVTQKSSAGVRTFTVSPDQLLTNRVGESLRGFGELFVVPLFASVLFLPFVRRKDVWILLIAAGATVAIQPHSWYGRYIPQLWVIPPLIFAALLSELRHAGFRYRRMSVIVCIMILLSLASFAGTFAYRSQTLWKTATKMALLNAYYNRDPEAIRFSVNRLVGQYPEPFKTYYYAMIADCFPKSSFGISNGQFIMRLMMCPVYYHTSNEDENGNPSGATLPTLRLRLRQVPKEMLKIRIRQLKNVWRPGTEACTASEGTEPFIQRTPPPPPPAPIDVRAILRKKLDTMLDECDEAVYVYDNVADACAYEKMLYDLEQFFLIQGPRFIEEAHQLQLLKRVEKAKSAAGAP